METEIKSLIEKIGKLPLAKKVEAINDLRSAVHEISPFNSEPVDCVLWKKVADVHANDYNPNAVAPPEMELLKLSVEQDGYTQPIVAWENGAGYEVVDGFHRHRVGRECRPVKKRVKGYLPITVIRQDREGRNDRIASTIRHNRARGKHAVTAMSDIVVELKRRNWSDQRISKELGMDQDEVLRLCQITGLEELFTDTEFSQSWTVEGSIDGSDLFEPLTDDIGTYGDEAKEFRTVNTSDEQRVFHTYDKWECFKAGLYGTHVDGMTKAECESEFASLLKDDKAFRHALKVVTETWKYSCEHYLTNTAMNRLAWLGQASCCQAKSIPATFKSGWFLLTENQQKIANSTALEFLNKWLLSTGRETVSNDDAVPDRQAEIY